MPWKTRVDGSPNQIGNRYEEKSSAYPYGAKRRASGANLAPQQRSVDSFKKPTHSLKMESEAARWQMAQSIDHIEVPAAKSIPVGSVRVKKVELRRAEGWTDDPVVGRWMSFDSVDEANAQLRENQKNMPKEQTSYDKHDFKVTFSDGSVYTGRYDLHVASLEADPNIGRQMHEFSKHVAKTDPKTFPHLTQQDRWQARYMHAITDHKHLQAEPKPKPESLASLEQKEAAYWKGMNKYIADQKAKGVDDYTARVRYARAHGKRRDLSPYIYRTQIGHYGGLFVEIPEEKFEGFKAHFPANEFPRKVETTDFNDPNQYHVEAIKKYHQKFPAYSGKVKQVYFADRSKGLKRLHYYEVPHKDNPVTLSIGRSGIALGYSKKPKEDAHAQENGEA